MIFKVIDVCSMCSPKCVFFTGRMRCSLCRTSVSTLRQLCVNSSLCVGAVRAQDLTRD